jgi:hypothetical protein
MRYRIATGLVAAALAVSGASQATAAERGPQDRAEVVTALEQRASLLDRRMSGKLAAAERQSVKKQRQEVDDLIRRLQAGGQVDQGELDRLLGSAAR